MAHEDALMLFRDSRGLPVQAWPKALLPSATVIIIEDAQTLPWRVLVHQRADNACWGFPGGRQEIGESIVACAIRECLEETGYAIVLDGVVAVDSDPFQGAIVVYDDGPMQYTNVTFLAHVESGTLRCSDESLQVQWVMADALPSPFLPTHLWRLSAALAQSACAGVWLAVR